MSLSILDFVLSDKAFDGPFTVTITTKDGEVYTDDLVDARYVDRGEIHSASSMMDHATAHLKRRWELGLTKHVIVE